MITDAIRDEKVLKFKVDYNDVRPQFKALETETDEKNSVRLKTNRHFTPTAYPEITQYILNNFRQKTHRTFRELRALTPC
ncbi:Type I restriction enzyme EcoR124II R protein [Klebsiella pneumoniae]|nr:Type I restriction enzyme EcoR124II R protein [Klebsiella pneumoniae]